MGIDKNSEEYLVASLLGLTTIPHVGELGTTLYEHWCKGYAELLKIEFLDEAGVPFSEFTFNTSIPITCLKYRHNCGPVDLVGEVTVFIYTESHEYKTLVRAYEHS